MCGIVGGFAPNAFAFLRDGLLRLEYRGYDSWGVAVVDGEDFQVVRRVGPPSCGLSHQKPLGGSHGIAHTRWASHGRVSLENTHPVSGGRDGSVFVVHNGIIENHAELKDFLLSQGYQFKTETDTEVIAHLLAHYLGDPTDVGANLAAVCRSMRGRYAFAAMSKTLPDRIILASFGSPLVACPRWGLFASDAVALSGHIPEGEPVYALRDQFGVLGPPDDDGLFFELALSPPGQECPVAVPAATFVAPKERGQWMRAEMLEQARMVRQGRLANRPLDGGSYSPHFVDGIHLFGCGSSYHAALLGRAYFEARTATPVDARLSTDFSAQVYDDHAYVAITQSGETADVLRVLERLAPARNVHVLTNRSHSTAARLGNVLEMGCGEERAVAATKSFLATCLRLLEMACDYMGDEVPDYAPLADALDVVSNLDIFHATDLLRAYRHYYVCGKGLMHPAALEGALKLKECAYRHCEGLHLSEVKHGPLACFNQNALVVVLVGSPQDLSGLQEIVARPCCVLALTSEDMAGEVRRVVAPSQVVPLPALDPELSPLLFVAYLQRLSYELGMLGGHDPDLPRAICKSVSVE